MSWKQRVIEEAKTSGLSRVEIRRALQNLCKQNCHVINYNYHCPRCYLVKHWDEAFALCDEK